MKHPTVSKVMLFHFQVECLESCRTAILFFMAAVRQLIGLLKKKIFFINSLHKVRRGAAEASMKFRHKHKTTRTWPSFIPLLHGLDRPAPGIVP